MLKIFPAVFFAWILWSGCGSPDPDKAQKGGIVSLLPSITEDLFALGLGDRVCGVSTFCRFPPEALAKPRVGDCVNPNLEAIARLRPGIVILGDMQTEALSKFKSLGIPVVEFRQSTVSDVLFTLRELGRLFQREKKADSLAAFILGRLDSLRVLNAGASPKPVLFVVGRNPGALSNIFTVNKESFLNELLEIAGGVSVFSDAKMIWAKVSAEEIIRRNPGYIIETSTMGHEDDPLKAWSSLPNIEAVKQGRVFMLPEDYIFIPGPRIVETAEKLAEILK